MPKHYNIRFGGATKICSTCKIDKPVDEFYLLTRHRSNGRQHNCKKCALERTRTWQRENLPKLALSAKQWRERNPDKALSVSRLAHIKSRGITATEYKYVFAQQNGVCFFCGAPPTPTLSLAIDHDHKCCPTRRRMCRKCVRGLLCGKCNGGFLPVAEAYVELQTEKVKRYLQLRPLLEMEKAA